MFASTFTATILAVSVKTVAADLDSTTSSVAWVLTAPQLAAAVAMPILGRLGDIRGHRRVYLIGFFISIAFNLATALAWNAVSLVAFRTVAQLAGTATVPATFAMLFRYFPPEQRMRAASWSSGVMSGSSVVGLAVGGPLIDWFGWRPLFLVQAGLSTVAVVAALFVLKPDAVRTDITIDKAGAAALAVAAFALTFGLNRLAVWGLHPIVIAMAVVLPFAVWCLVRVERRVRDPILPIAMIKIRNVRAVAITSFLIGFAWTGNFFVTPLLLQTIFELSATRTSFISMIRTLSISLSAPIASLMSQRFGERRVAIVAGAFVVVAIAGLGLGANSEALAIVIGSLFVTGVAWGHFQPAILAVIGNSVDPFDLGFATSLQQTANSIGGVTGTGLLTAIAADATTRGPYVNAYLMSAAVGALAVVAMTRTQRPKQS